jgi:copper homeostasis protein
MSITVEIAVDTLDDAIAAERGGAHRIELCSDLPADGLSPSLDLLKQVRSAVTIPIHVMVRPRGGDFFYSEQEFRTMKAEIDRFKSHGADGLVFGILSKDRTVDVERTAELVLQARPLGVTFHRAFDVTVDPLTALEAVIAAHAERLLTSGQKLRAPDGIALLQQLIHEAAGRVAIMPGAGIDITNAGSLLKALNVREVHIGKGVKRLNPAGVYEVDEEKVRRLIGSLETR